MADVIKATTVGGEPAAISLPLQFRRAWRFSRLGRVSLWSLCASEIFT